MKVNNLENANRHFTKRMGSFGVLEYDKDLSVNFYNAESEYFASKMGVHRRQLVIDMNGGNTAVVQAGAMQWMAGNVVATSGFRSALGTSVMPAAAAISITAVPPGRIP